MSVWRPSTHFLTLALFVSGASLFGQSPDTTTIRGTVLNSLTHEPIERALVSSSGNRFAAMTDSEGQFEFEVPTDTCGSGNPRSFDCLSFSARKPGFLKDNTQWQPLVPGKDLTFALTPEALIIGHVQLPTTEPPERIRVELYRREITEGRGHWSLVGNTGTRSNGQFRFADLAAGSYKLLTGEALDRDSLTSNPRVAQFGYPPVYFPNATDFESAQAIQLSAGQTVQAEITLVKHPYYSVKIPLLNPPPGSGVNVDVSVQGHNGPGFSLGYNFQQQVIDGMLPDRTYTVEAWSFGQFEGTAIATITVKGKPVEGPKMVLVQNPTIPVNTREEFTSTESEGGYSGPPRRGLRGSARYLNVRLDSADFDDHRRSSFQSASPPNDDSIIIEQVRPGSYWVVVNSSRGYASSITSGGVDLQKHPLVVPPAGSVDPIEITLRDDWAKLDFTVEGAANSNGSQTSGPAAHVYIVPEPDSPGEFRDIWIPPSGNASAQVPPGLYRVLTFDDPQTELEYHNPEAMRAYEMKGQVVRLVSGQTEHLKIQPPSPSE